MRKLASIQTVLEILSIENADNIELVKINGWQCVVKKNEFKVGDKGIYIEIDSVLPDTDMFSFLWSKRDKETGDLIRVPRPNNFRIKTMKLRSALSQGLFLPISTIGDYNNSLTVEQKFDNINSFYSENIKQEFETSFHYNNRLSLISAIIHTPKIFESELYNTNNVYFDGDNVTALLNIVKYEPIDTSHGNGQSRGSFPSYVPKTDQERVQSSPRLIDELLGKKYVITTKIDGQSFSAGYDLDDVFTVCSRNQMITNDWGTDSASTFWKMAHKYNLIEKLKDTGYWVQCEQVGPGIQKNRLGLKEYELFCFNVYDTRNNCYLDFGESTKFCESISLPLAPVEEISDNFNYTMNDLMEKSQGKYLSGQLKEGIVVSSYYESESRYGHHNRLSFKFVNPEFLLKGGD